ncbi:hypothetical protein Tco_1196105 [Tanacetum coccineum]
MMEMILEKYVTITRGNYILGNDGEKIIEKSVLKLKGKFLTELQYNAFSGTNGENAVEHVEKFLKVVDSLKIPRSPLYQAFKELNCPYSMDGDGLTDGTHEFKTNEECKDDWIYKQNNRIPWVDEKPWTDNGECAEPMGDIRHQCRPLHFKIGIAKWPTCNWKEDGYFNTEELLEFIREGSLIRYESYEWYDIIEDKELKEESLRNKKILEE